MSDLRPSYGRPEIEVSLEELKNIMSFYPSLDEVASWFDCSPDTVERRVRGEWGVTFKELRERSAGKTRLLLKRKAISKALEEDNEKMLIYCLRTMTELDDRKEKESVGDNGMIRLAYTVSQFSEDELKL